jgi:hypothetical protein
VQSLRSLTAESSIGRWIQRGLTVVTDTSMARSRYIDFISSYCDRWCERCQFTGRCSAFAAQQAIEMCGNARDGLELALGPPPSATPAHEYASAAHVHGSPTQADIDEYRRGARARDARVDESAVTRLADAYTVLAHRWLRQHTPPTGDPIAAEAFEIVSWDHMLITVKLHRAVSGYDEHVHGDFPEPDIVKADFNGSAKVALISIDRSEAAWRAIAAVAIGEAPLMFADQLAQLRGEVEAAFPQARAFNRPGFDTRDQRGRQPG